MVGESASTIVSGKGVHQPVKVSLLPLCEMGVTGNCAFVYATSYFLVCSAVMLPVCLYMLHVNILSLAAMLMQRNLSKTTTCGQVCITSLYRKVAAIQR